MKNYTSGAVGVLGFMVVFLLLCLDKTSAQGHKGYFGVNSYAKLPNILQIKQHIGFSFRTCAYGELLHQKGEKDSLSISVTKNGSLEITWNVSNIQETVLIGSGLANNVWYTVDIKFQLGNVSLVIEQGSTQKFSAVLSTSTFRRYLWDINLKKGTKLRVGYDFIGCISEGPSLKLSDGKIESKGVQWNSCPLETKSCGATDINNCWSYPCVNDGTCEDLYQDYRCSCPIPYTGKNCDVDLGYLGCALNPCQNSGTCKNVTASTRTYKCECLPGYTGTNCEIDIKECQSSPCKNNGACQDGVNEYTCNCAGTGYTGNNCATDINECTEGYPCIHGDCTNNPGSYKCTCKPGYTGKNCDKEANECLSSPCKNGGTCSDLQGKYECQCVAGYSGINCETNVDDCSGVTCSVANTECVDGLNQHTCSCKPGFQDPSKSAGDATSCVDIDECASNPCKEGATCVNGENAFSCTCAPGYTGAQCQTDIDECASNPCQNGATCGNLLNGHRCTCAAGFSGEFCEVNIDECLSTPCKNGASCTDVVNGFTCRCISGWTGDLCETEVNECESNPCVNGATCQEGFNQYRCACPAGYTDVNCETNINECFSNPCKNGGSCKDGINEFSCTCTDEWMGKTCETAYDACSFSPCKNGATCSTTSPSREYTCACVVGFSGSDCETNIDDCVGASCPSHTVCIDGVNTHTCQCPVGYTGSLCETNIDECASAPCANSATCQDGVGNFTCQCVTEIVDLTKFVGTKSEFRSGWEGATCEKDIDECLYDPPICLNDGICRNSQGSYKCHCGSKNAIYFTGNNCELSTSYCTSVKDPPACHNGGTCVPQPKGFTCNCAPGYTGERCTIDIDECASNPCQMNGTCTDRIAGYTCECIAGLTGPNCDVNIDECASAPCQNTGQCIDLINSYVCNCTDTGFNGTHCEHNIDDCASSPCVNDATCTDAIKDYNCTCHPGYSGKNCEIDINECASSPCQNGATCLQKSNMTLYDLGYRNHTNFNYSTAEGYWCECIPGFTGIHCETNIDECASSPCVNGACVDGINGFACDCQAGYEGILCDREIDECLKYSPCQNGATCTDMFNDYNCTCAAEYQGEIYAGKNCSVELIGCDHQPCENGGQCRPLLVDEKTNVHNYTCQCKRPYTGRNCSIAWAAATFGRKNSVSLATFVIPEDMKAGQKSSNDLSFFIRTRDENGFLAYLGGKDTGAREENTYIAMELLGGRLRVRVRLSNFVKIYDHGPRLDDGQQHLVGVKRIKNDLTVIVDGGEYKETIDAMYPMNAENLYIGSLPGFGSTRKRRAVNGIDTDAFSSETPFQGTVQGGDLSGTPLEFVDTPFAGKPATLKSTNAGLEEGEVQTLVCDGPSPCVNNGTCQNVFWNDYVCLCPKGFRGKDCSALDFCLTNTCPSNSTCRDLDDGYDCVIPATFDGVSSELVYTTNINRTQINTISFKFRSRQSTGLILSIATSQGRFVRFVNLNLREGKLDLIWQSGTVSGNLSSDSAVTVNDGSWHSVKVEILPNSVSMLIDGWHNISGMMNVVIDLTNLVRNGVVVLGGRGLLPYKGCLDDVKLGNIFLPFFNQSELANNTAAEQFFVHARSQIRYGCHGDPVCNTDKCENNATCVDIWNAYTCTCPAGFNGSLCEINIDECVGHACQNGGACVDGIANYTCNCAPGYTGFRCETEINECAPDPCQNNATCIDQVAKFECNCTTNYTGIYCERLITDNCNSTPCYNNATCHDIMEPLPGQPAFNCSCLPGYEGELCANVIDYCINNTCASGSTCLSSTKLLNYTCLCPPGKEGYLCDMEIDECDPKYHNNTHACNNNGTCTDGDNDFNCTCVSGWIGKRCEIDINECNITAGLCNVGECVNTPGSYKCNCTGTGYHGLHCENETNECLFDPCQNGANCTNTIGDYYCNCTLGYDGKNCHIPNCNYSQCFNNATCDDSGAQWKCNCLEFYSGVRCEVKGVCADYPCKNGATCNQSGGNYTCTCPPGWEGENCDTDIKECDLYQPCKNGATCEELRPGYRCNCVPGYTGRNCSIDIDECSSDPCKSKGTCTNELNRFVCDCSGTGYEGADCGIQINECERNPNLCKNGATCVDLPGSFRCDCTTDFLRPTCYTKDPCSGNGTCLNGGTCTSYYNDTEEVAWRTCFCPDGFQGDFCQIRDPIKGEVKGPDQQTVQLIIGLSVGGLLLIIVIVIIVFLIMAKNKRATRGTYSPSRQEMSGSRVEMGNVMKPPPEERLI